MSPHKKFLGWADGAEVTSRRYYGRRKPLFKGAGWPSGEGQLLCEVLMLGHEIKYQVAHLVATQKVHRLGGWC